MNNEFKSCQKFVITEEMLDTKKWITADKVAAFLEKIGFGANEEISVEFHGNEKYNNWKAEIIKEDNNYEEANSEKILGSFSVALAA